MSAQVSQLMSAKAQALFCIGTCAGNNRRHKAQQLLLFWGGGAKKNP